MFPLSTKGFMCSYASMLQTIDTTKDSFINRMMARNILQFRLYSSCKNKKINLVWSKNWNVTLIIEVYCDYRIAISEIFRHVTTPTHEFSVQNCVSFPRLHYKGTHSDFRNHIYLKVWDFILAHVINTAFMHTWIM